jgi:hypothetical protein
MRVGLRFTRTAAFVFGLVPLFLCAIDAKAAPACATYGDQYSATNYLYDLYMHPATTCIEYFNPVSRIVSGGNLAPQCGTWAARSDAPGFQYTSNGRPCHDWLRVRIQMPDQGLWDYFYLIVVYPDKDPLPQP